MTDLWTYLKNTDKPIVLYGTGNGADKIYARLQKDGINISGVFASEGFKKGKEFGGFTVTSYNELKEKYKDMIILVCFGSHLENVIENILSLEKENELYLPDVPVYGEEIFDLSFAVAYRKELEDIYNILADDLSKKVFENTVYYKLTGKSKYLTEIETPREEVFDILSLKGERFLDLGAYNGDTVEEFIKYDSHYKTITALEPDSRNFRRLVENTEKFRDITLINSAVDIADGVLRFSKNKGRGNSQGGKTLEIPCTSIDEISKKNPPTFIKMDVEGNEMRAILGGVATIKSKPKMHIAAYHRSEDIFAIPLKLLEINHEYKIYMRKHRALPGWDINFIIK